MSRDLRILYLLLPIDYNNLDVVEGKVVIKAGSGMAKAVDVEVNGVSVPFVINSDTRITATASGIDSVDDISEVRVWSEQQLMGESQLIKFEVGDHPAEIEGIEKLVQQFVLILFKDPGTDVFHPREGGGLLGFSKSFLSGDKNLAAGEINTAVKKVTRQLRKKQLDSGVYIPPAERLVSAQLLRLDVAHGAVRVFIEIMSAVGKYAVGMEV